MHEVRDPTARLTQFLWVQVYPWAPTLERLVPMLPQLGSKDVLAGLVDTQGDWVTLVGQSERHNFFVNKIDMESAHAAYFAPRQVWEDCRSRNGRDVALVRVA
jgi:hypothetical protein